MDTGKTGKHVGLPPPDDIYLYDAALDSFQDLLDSMAAVNPQQIAI